LSEGGSRNTYTVTADAIDTTNCGHVTGIQRTIIVPSGNEFKYVGCEKEDPRLRSTTGGGDRVDPPVRL
jgi:hypothetical protein